MWMHRRWKSLFTILALPVACASVCLVSAGFFAHRAIAGGGHAAALRGAGYLACLLLFGATLALGEGLRRSLARSRALLNAFPDLFFVFDRQGRYLACHAPQPGRWGVTPERFLGRTLSEMLPPPAAELLLKGIRQVLEDHGTRTLAYALVQDGAERHREARLMPYEGATVLAIVRDVTEERRLEAERREMEAQIQHAQKMESLGRLAGGVAHDMNNVLGAIQAVSQTLLLTHGSDRSLAPSLATVDRAATRGRDLVKALTRFARKDLRAPEILDVNQLAREELEILDRTAGKKVRLVFDPAPGLPGILGERGTLSSALMNLCVNALDAMPGGGTLTLRTRVLPGGDVGLEVQDTGEGMAPHILARAMEPFFTTKPAGKGTGLGLSSVYATARAHGGAVEIQSEPGVGTLVLVRLPPAPAGAEGREEGGCAEMPARSLSILVVDDDELIRASFPGLLRARGHRVETAPGGPEALARLGGGSFDLLVLDLDMPGMDGLETLRRIRALGSAVPVLLASGRLDEAVEAELAADGRAAALAKPFSVAELEAKLGVLAPGLPLGAR